MAAMFAVLPEAERCATILFYLYLFDPNSLAELLGVKSAELATLLNRGRSMLQKAEGARQKAEVEN